MKGFWSRLDKYVDAVIELDSLWSVNHLRSPVPLKVLFDNLRYYTVLAFLWLGVKLLRESGSALTASALGLIVIALGILTVMQTATIFMAAALSTTLSLLPRAHSVSLRRSLRSKKIAIKLISLLIVLPIIGLVMTVASSLFLALSKANLL